MLTRDGIGVFIRIVDANGKTSEEIAHMYKEAAERDPLGRVAFCTEREVAPEEAEKFEKVMLAFEKAWGEYGYLLGDVKKVETSYDPNARKGFKRKIMGSFSDLLPRDFNREMKHTWILLDNVEEVEPEDVAHHKVDMDGHEVDPESLLKNIEKGINFTYFK